MAATPGQRDVVIVAAVRTPLGAFQGALSSFSAPDLGAFAIKAALERAGVAPSAVDEVFFGNVCSANIGQAPATQAALKAGLPTSVPCTTVNKVCSSGLKAVMLADQSIRLGQNEIVVAGGMESMSNVPYYLPAKARSGLRMGHSQLVDGMVKDGLWDPYSDFHMGVCAEMCVERYGLTRQQMDAHAAASHSRARAAAAAGHTAREVVPISVGGGARGGAQPRWVAQDEGPQKMDEGRLPKLQPAFKKGEAGTVTAGNSSPVTDGAAALVLCSRAKAQELGLPVLAVVCGYADANQAPEWFTTAPSLAIPKALARAGVAQHEIDYFEVNEAFSAVILANNALLGLDPERVNAHGGAVALGHPIGASGARILVTLINVLATHGGRLGCAAICNGGGGASALILERGPQDMPRAPAGGQPASKL